MEKFQFESPRSEADEQQAHSMIPKTDRYTDTLKQALTRQRQMSNTNAYGRKGRERDCTQMPMAKKERTDHKCLWQETKTKPQMLVVNEKWLPLSGKQTADTK